MNRIDRLIVACPNWAALWAALTTSTEVDTGEAFERLTQLYLQSHAEYRTQLEHVWRVPEEVPPRIRQRLNLPSTDEGIDLLARTHDGKFWAIQCKFRSDTRKPLTYGELSTFTSLAFVTCKDISLAVVAHTCSKPVRKNKYLGNATEIGLDRWLGLTDEDWQGIQAQIKGKLGKLKPGSPRPHQQAAIEAARRHFAKEARGRMIMPCATGKSLTAFWIARALDAKSIIVAVPSLALIRQSLLDWTREYLAHGEEPQWLVVCSDESTGKLEQDEFVGQTYDLGIPTTTQSEEIIPFLRKRTGRRVVFTTYQSSGTLAAAAREAGVRIDLAILDEAHKTVGVKSKAFATLLSDASIPVQRRLFMTATERVLRGESDDVFSMDDEAVYGPRFHQLTFKDAIAQGIISDYKILTITVSDQTIRELVAENRLIDVKGDETDAQSLAAAVALRRSFEKHGITHAISFHRSIKAASTFADRQAVLDDAMQSPLTSLHVSSKKSAGERAELMREFVGEPRALMTNARCLTEGVDVPAIDCVLFADPKQSVVDIVQAAGRALRPYPGKDYGYILLPLVVPAGMTVDTFAETTEFKQVARTITALSTQDERIAEQFRVVEHGRKPAGKIVEIEGDVPVGQQLNVAEFADQIGTRIWERVGKLNWRPFHAAREFVHTLGLNGQSDWYNYARSDARPADVPYVPSDVYRQEGWRSWGDWLGTGTIATYRRVYRSFREARAYVHTLRLSGQKAWFAFARSRVMPTDIPAAPNIVYRGNGWIGWGDWLGTGTIAPGLRTYRSFREARAYVHTLRLSGQKAWFAFARSNAMPMDIPVTPHLVYRDQGWVSWDDWHGTGAISTSQRVYRPFHEARKFVRALGLRTQKDWQAYTRGTDFPSDIPTTPARVYQNSGWVGFGDWLGTGAIASQKRAYRSFHEARKFVRALGLRTQKDWQAYAKSAELPSDIPRDQTTVYRGQGWTGIGDSLGTGTIAKFRRVYRPFEEARAFIQKQGLQSVAEWQAFARSESLPADIPASPDKVYCDTGWLGFGDWLGTGTLANFRRVYRPFEEARVFVRALGLRTRAEWDEYAKSEDRPADIPAGPRVVYLNRGWIGWGDWLGTGAIASFRRVFRPFHEARAFVHTLGLRGEDDWKSYTKSGSLPSDIPVGPFRVYREQGWVSWGDWLGTGTIASSRRIFRSFEEARAFVRSLGLRTQKDWQAYARSEARPADIPGSPDRVYRDQGWGSLGDWLGSTPRRLPKE